MKGTCLFFLMIGYASSTFWAAYAGPAIPASQETSPEGAENTVSDHLHDAEHAALADGERRQKGGKPSSERRDLGYLSGKNHPHSSATLTKDRPKQHPNNRERCPSGNAVKFHRPGSDKFVGAAKGGPIQNETVRSGPAARQPNVIRLAGPSPSNVRHHGASPAVIGGSANSAGRNNSAINGTGMHRRP